MAIEPPIRTSPPRLVDFAVAERELRHHIGIWAESSFIHEIVWDLQLLMVDGQLIVNVSIHDPNMPYARYKKHVVIAQITREMSGLQSIQVYCWDMVQRILQKVVEESDLCPHCMRRMITKIPNNGRRMPGYRLFFVDHVAKCADHINQQNDSAVPLDDDLPTTLIPITDREEIEI